MAKPIVMPQVGQDLTEGTLIEWFVKVGDEVKKGDVVALVESEKASFEVEAYEEGTVLELFCEAGGSATVLAPLLTLSEPGETLEKKAKTSGSVADTPVAKSETTPAKSSVPVGQKANSSSPLARRLAAQKGLDITKIEGSGPKGSVVKRDIEAAAQASATAPAASSQSTVVAAEPAPTTLPLPTSEDDVELPFNRMRQVIAERLALSKRTIPHFYLMAEADVSDLQIRRKAHFDITGEKLSLNDVIVHATALTLLEFSELNAFVSSNGVLKKAEINIGVAVSVDDGLMVPAIANAPHKNISEISALIREYAAAARRGINKSQAKSTFSISNLGMYDVEVLPIINPPEAGILGVGPIKRKVREHRGGIQGRDIMSFSLAVDHRAVDGAYGARFLQSLCKTIEAYNEFS